MSKIYGYARISHRSQSMERQRRNIKAAYPDAVLVEETFTGTRLEGRHAFETLLHTVRPGDTIVFDSVSRMSRNAAEGFACYQALYQQGVELVFLKEPQINTSVYREAIEKQLPTQHTGDAAADELLSAISSGVNRYVRRLQEKQIQLAFQQSEKEVEDLRQRTREGLETARLQGKQLGCPKGRKLCIKKKAPAMAAIRRYSKDFEGTLTDIEAMRLVGVSKNTYYRYKRELREGRSY